MTAPLRSTMEGMAARVDAAINGIIGLLMLTFSVGIVLLVYIALGPVRERAEAVALLWPLAAVWCAGLAGAFASANATRRELIRADTLVGAAERHRRWATPPRPAEVASGVVQ